MTKYRVEVDSLEELTELEGSWLPADYVAILEELDVDGAAAIPAEELRDMCLLALQDLEPPEAAAVLLKYRLGTELTDGQIRNFSIESQHERLWEQSADLEFHQRMFAIASLLNTVNEMEFPTPDALCVTLIVSCADPASLAVFEDSMDPALLVRLLSAGMDDSAILNRLFGEQIAAGRIDDAGSIIWAVRVDGSEQSSIRLQITSSAYWLNAIRETESFEWDADLVTQ
ncbi:MAG: hypothetical protein RIK87_01965 [Fuerstiella sp.]